MLLVASIDGVRKTLDEPVFLGSVAAWAASSLALVFILAPTTTTAAATDTVVVATDQTRRTVALLALPIQFVLCILVTGCIRVCRIRGRPHTPLGQSSSNGGSGRPRAGSLCRSACCWWTSAGHGGSGASGGGGYAAVNGSHIKAIGTPDDNLNNPATDVDDSPFSVS